VSDATHRAAGGRIVSFLKDALAERDPERDIPLAEEIVSEIEASTPALEEERMAALVAVARPVIEDLASRPDAWSEAINLIAIYLDGERRGPQTEGLRLSSIVLRGLLWENKAGRSALFQGIDEWNVLSALEPILPGLELDAAEVVTLLRRVDAFTANDMARGTPMEALKRWAAAHAGTAGRIVDAWLGDEGWTEGLALSSVQVLVEGAVRAEPQLIAWRDTVIGRLVASNDEQRWALAAILACFAWPEPEPPVEARHKALLEHVGRLPARLVDVGLRALVRDARAHPAPSITTALRLVAALPPGAPESVQRQARASCLAEIGWRALLGAKDKGAPPPLVHVLLPHVVDAPLEAGVRIVDLLVAELATSEPSKAESFAAQWLAAHVDSLREEAVGLQDVLPLFSHRLGPEAMGAWLVRCMVDSQPEVRLAAAFLVARKRGYVIREKAFEALSARLAEAFVHELAGIGVPGQIYIPLLVRLARARADVHGVIRAVLLEDAIEDYPGVCRETLARWDEGGGTGDPLRASLRAELAALVEQRTTRYLPQREVPELLVSSPARPHWLVLQSRVFQEAFRAERSSGRHPLMDIAVQVPIARGEGTRFDASGEIVPFRTLSGTTEFPARDSVDQVAPVLARIRHRERAAALLAEDEGGA
jgi:hypothetical protein